MRLGATEAVIVFPSSRLVYAPKLPVPVPETAPTTPLSIYGAHKLVAENYLRIFGLQHGLKSVVMRITNPYGPYQRPEQRSYGVINQFIHEAMRGRSITVFGRGEQLRDVGVVGQQHSGQVAAVQHVCVERPRACHDLAEVRVQLRRAPGDIEGGDAGTR